MSKEQEEQFGRLALEYCKVQLPLRVLESQAGFYLGTKDEEGPFSRESQEYWPTREEAEKALHGDIAWTQKPQP